IAALNSFGGHHGPEYSILGSSANCDTFCRRQPSGPDAAWLHSSERHRLDHLCVVESEEPARGHRCPELSNTRRGNPASRIPFFSDMGRLRNPQGDLEPSHECNKKLTSTASSPLRHRNRRWDEAGVGLKLGHGMPVLKLGDVCERAI